MVKATWNGVVLAESDRTSVVEGNHYFPPDSLHAQYFKPSATHTICSWKGTASYYHLEAGRERNPNGAWTYRHPYPWIRKIKNRVAFWNGVRVVPD